MTGELFRQLRWVQWSALAAAGLALAALYAGSETGIYVLNKLRLDLRAESGQPAARSLRRLLRRPEGLLAALLIGTNLATYVTTFAIGAMFVMAGAGPRAAWYTLAAATPLLFVFAESLPKNLFQGSAETLVYRAGGFLRGSMIAFTACGVLPLVRGFAALFSWRRGGSPPLMHEGLAAILTEGQAAGLLTHSQRIMADRVMHLPEVLVADVYHPMHTALWAPRNVSRQELLYLAKDHNYSRIPLVGADQHVVGILDLYEALMSADPADPARAMTPPMLLSARLPVTEALYRMQRAHERMAIVTDPNDRHVGLVTIKDLVEEIVGELEAW